MSRTLAETPGFPAAVEVTGECVAFPALPTGPRGLLSSGCRSGAREKRIMKPLLEISFGTSPSANYSLAVGLAERVPGYHASGTGRQIIHTVATSAPLSDETTWERLHHLMRLVSGWRSTQILMAGQRINYWALTERLARIKSCHARKVSEGGDARYCSGKHTPSDEASYFGCRLSKGVTRSLTMARDGNAWIRFGTLSAKGDAFRVDKKAIYQVLKTQTMVEACLFCPAFRWQQVRAEVDALPGVIRLGEKSPFEIHHSEIDPTKALGIQVKETTPADGAGRPSVREGEKPALRQVPQVRYADVAGQDAALEALRSVVELPLCHAAYFEALGVAPQSGVLLYGPPGNGKTLLAKAVATESNAHLEIISGPEVLSPWVGRSEENLRQIFTRARQLAPSVVLIDELDSIAPRRAMLSHQHQVQLLSQLLVLLDGLEARGRVAVVGTTNRIEALDPAVCRPGRFDYHIEVASPSREGRSAILRVHLGKIKTRSNLQLDRVVERTAGFSGADLASLCREAGLRVITRGLALGIPAARLAVGLRDLEGALEALQAKRVDGQARLQQVAAGLSGN
jgi:SpoVK/Ycf46/Vps4 family AAA+-type ATPase